MGIAACAGPLDRRVEHVLDVAGDNRGELEAVLAHYRDDPEKLHAARLLIAEMEEAYYYDAPEVDSLKDVMADTRRAETRPAPARAERWKAFDYRVLPRKQDAQTLTADYLTGHIDQAFRAWRERPWGRHYAYEDFCRYVLPYRIGDETPRTVDGGVCRLFRPPAGLALYGQRPDSGGRHRAAPPGAAGLHLPDGLPHAPPGALHLLENRTGGCREFTDLLVYVFRSLGIPVAKDMFLCAPDFRHSHTWNAVMDTTGRFIPVEPMEPAGSTDLRRRWQNRRNKGKVYRLYSLRQDEPDFAGNHYRADVTDEYYPANRVEVPVETDGGRGLLAVFATEGWRPVGGYRSRRGKAVVEDVQEEMIFQPLSVQDGRLCESGWPFFVHAGRAVVLKPDTAHRVEVRLTRKYPVGWRMKENLDFAVDNVLEGSNDPDFRRADRLGRVTGSSVDRLGRYPAVACGQGLPLPAPVACAGQRGVHVRTGVLRRHAAAGAVALSDCVVRQAALCHGRHVVGGVHAGR